MKSAILLGIIGLGSLAACQEQEKSTTTVVSEEKELPGKERAAKAAADVRPGLERDLAVKGLHLGDPVFIRAFKRERELELYVRSRVTEKFDHFRTSKSPVCPVIRGRNLRRVMAKCPRVSTTCRRRR